MHRRRVEAIVERDVAGQGIKDPLLRLDRDDRPPARHVARPFDRMDTDIGAAVDHPDAVAVMLAPLIEEKHRHIDLFRVERRVFEDLDADAIDVVGAGDMVVEAIEDQRAVARRSEDETDPLP